MMKIVNGELTDVSDADIKDGVFFFTEGVKTIGIRAFTACTRLQSITIPKGFKAIGERAFQECTNLERVIIPEGVETIGEAAFHCCTSLQSITLPTGLQKIGQFALEDCASLQSIVVPEGVKEFGYAAFRRCTSLQSIALPGCLERMGYDVFNECANLRFIYISASNADEHQRIKNLLHRSVRCSRIDAREKWRDRVVAHQFTQRLPDMVNKELQRILQTATSNRLRQCAKKIDLLPEELFTVINNNTNPNDHPIYQIALREIGKLALPDSEEAFATYAKEVRRLVDNTIAKSNKVVGQVSRQTRLYDIVSELIGNIENRQNGRGTLGKESIKVGQLHKLKQAILAYPADKWLEREADFIEQIRTVCASRHNKMHFWKTPESLGEFDTLLLVKGFIREATETAPLLK